MTLLNAARIGLTAIAIALVFSSSTAAARFKVMIATWRGCEEACMGAKDALAQSGLDVEIIERDAAGNTGRLPAFLAEARAERMDLIITWGTSVTVGIAGTLADRDNPAFNHEIPQVFMIVADPVGAALVESLERTGRRNLTGTYNRVPEQVNIGTIRTYLPGFRHLGMLFNGNEPNSVLKRNEMAQLADALGYDLTALELPLRADGRPHAEDIPSLMRELRTAGVDFVYVGSSSFLRAHGAVLTAAAREAGLPLLSPYEELVPQGALISVAARYRDIGRLAGQQAVRMLSGDTPPQGLPVAQMTEFAVVINIATARALGMYPPIGLLQIAETVN